MLEERLRQVVGRIEAACRRSGREPGDVRLLPVTKTVAPERVAAAAACGLRVFGESRVQEARQKIPLCSTKLEWHFIGHLQTNKVKEAVQLFRMIHAVDSLKLLRALDMACESNGITLPVLLEVNVSGESTKYGLKPDEVPDVLEQAGQFLRIEIAGLMTIPPLARDPEQARPFFRRLRELRDAWRDKSGMALTELSMGMSNDFEVAVEEGATWVRIGTLLFGER